MNRLEGKSQVNRLACLFACTYMVSYITRINYGAIISEMEAATAVSRDLLSMALTFRDHAALSAIAAYHFGPQLEMGFCFFGNLRHRDACCMESLFL